MLVFYLMIAIMPLEESDLWGRTLFGTITMVKVVGLSCVAVAVWRMFLEGRAPKFLYSPQAKWYVALFIVQCLNFFVHGGELPSADRAYSQVLSIFGLFIVVHALVTCTAYFDRTMLVAIGALAYTSLHAVRQQLLYGGDFAGYRASGMFEDSNQYALLANLWVPLGFLWVLAKRPAGERVFVGGCLFVTVLGTTFAASRGGMIGSVVALIFLAIRSQRRLRNLSVIAGVMLPVLLLWPNSALWRTRNPSYGDKQAEQARLITWSAGLRMFEAHPLTGVGLHNFKPLVHIYERADEEVIKLAHNTYIEMAAETGLPGIVCYVGVLFASVYSMEVSRRRALKAHANHLAMFALGIEAGLVSFLVSAFFITSWWEKIAWLMIFSSMVLHRACAIRLSTHNRKRTERKAKALQERAARVAQLTFGDISAPLRPTS